MATVMVKPGGSTGPGRSRAQDIDRHVGARMRERRIMLGLTQQQMAELIGVTYQQAHKYEKGINRIASGRRPVFAQRGSGGRQLGSSRARARARGACARELDRAGRRLPGAGR